MYVEDIQKLSPVDITRSHSKLVKSQNLKADFILSFNKLH